jgi:hypothetical protein
MAVAEEITKKSEATRTQGRGPAYPFITLGKAVERAEQIRDANMARIAASPLAIYKVWGWKGDNGDARQSMAALNHFGLIEYIGRGNAREARLSDLARRIVMDKVPGSKDRADAIRIAALEPPIHKKLWDQFGSPLPPDVVLETFLMRDCAFNESGAKNLIGEYRATFEYAGLDKPDNIPPETENIPEPDPMSLETVIQPSSTRTPVAAASASLSAFPTASGENDIKVLLDGDRLRVSAYVDLKGLKRLKKILDANAALLEASNDEDDQN